MGRSTRRCQSTSGWNTRTSPSGPSSTRKIGRPRKPGLHRRRLNGFGSTKKSTSERLSVPLSRRKAGPERSSRPSSEGVRGPKAPSVPRHHQHLDLPVLGPARSVQGQEQAAQEAQEGPMAARKGHPSDPSAFLAIAFSRALFNPGPGRRVQSYSGIHEGYRGQG